jgi:hypothetical protein
MSATVAVTTMPQMSHSPIVRVHAQLVNATYNNSASNYVTLAQRLKQCQSDPMHDRMIKQAQKHWRLRYPQIKQWNQIVLGQAQSVPLSMIQIDTTLQREVIVYWLCQILQEFKDLRVMPICVYQDSAQPRPHFKTCWDGQHTALCLWIIAVCILGLDPDKCEVPVFVHPSTSREQMRENFTELNGTAKKAVSNAEMFRQEVLGVRVDNSKRPDWLESELKQRILETHSLFVVDENHNLANQAGAITNMSELLATGIQGTGKQYKLDEHLKPFCMLMDEVGLNRAVQSKEMWQWMDFFKLCGDQGIVVDATYIETLSLVIMSCFNRFDSDQIHDKGKQAYLEWYRNDRMNANGMETGHSWTSAQRKKYHVHWLISVLNKWSTLQLPVAPHVDWPVAPQYLELGYLSAP